MEQTSLEVPERTPPAWVNAMVRGLLVTPGIQRLVGRALALLRFTGRRTGTGYALPVSYDRRGAEILIVTKKSRSWWRNFEAGHPVELRLSGRVHRGHGVASVGDTSRLPRLRDYLTARKYDAKAFGVRMDEDGQANADDVALLLPQIVLIDITLE